MFIVIFISIVKVSPSRNIDSFSLLQKYKISLKDFLFTLFYKCFINKELYNLRSYLLLLGLIEPQKTLIKKYD